MVSAAMTDNARFTGRTRAREDVVSASAERAECGQSAGQQSGGRLDHGLARVCHVHGSALGVRWKIEQLRDLRDRYGYDVVALVGEPSGDFIDQLRAEGIPYHVADLSIPSLAAIWKLPVQIVRLALLFREQQFDVVQTSLFHSMMLCRVAGWLADVPVRVVMLAAPLHLEAPTSRWIDQATCWMESMMIASCELTRTLYRELGVEEDRLALIYYGPDASRFDPHRIEPVDLRPEYGWGPETRLIGNVAYFYWRGPGTRWNPPTFSVGGFKGQEDIIRAAPAVLREASEARFLLIGSGAGAEGERFFESMQALVRELGLEEQVVFPGYRADSPGIIRTLAVSVQAALSENLGGTVESLLLERPMVATRVGGMVDSVRPGETGVLVEPNDPASLAEGILTLLRDPAEAERLGQAGRALMLERFTLERTVADLDAVYRRALWRGGVRQRGYRPWVSLGRFLRFLPVALYLLIRLCAVDALLLPLLDRLVSRRILGMRNMPAEGSRAEA